VSWDALASRGMAVRPFDGAKPSCAWRSSPFGSTLTKTLETLERELRMLGATKIVVELDVREQDIRLDGYPRANAKLGNPAVAISFESKHGPLRYATGEYRTWQDNLRAIALSMESLRAVDRYGVSKRGEQYRGWRAIAAGSQSVEDAIPDAEAARAFLAEKYDGDLRRALFASHPDHGGSSEDFHKVARCKELLA
jgi:hypothetical protein